jgi:hypothetical protein
VIDVDERRAPILSLHQLPNVDRPYRFFHDETNNVRKLRIRGGALNVAAAEPFVLGGIIEPAPGGTFDGADLRRTLRLQSNISDIKLRHLGSGDFLQLLDAKRVTAFLQWLTERDLFIHYQAVDLLYWTSVDIIDSILADAGDQAPAEFHFAYKDSLFSLLRSDLGASIAIFARYGYPDVGNRHREFLDEILALLEGYQGLGHFERYMLKGILQIGRKAGELPFLANETPNLLVDGMGPFVVERICLFKPSTHVIDEEPVIQRYLADHPLSERGLPFCNYRFADSASEPGIQIADIVAGLLGKAFGYLARTELHDLEADLSGLSLRQRNTLRLLAKLLDRSVGECPAFAHHIIPLSAQARGSMLFAA